MKQRNVMAVIFLSIITLGIYDLYWLVKTKKELNARTSVHTPSIWLLFAPYLVLFVGVIVSLLIPQGGGSDPYATTNGSSTAVNAVLLLVYLLAFLVVLPITFYWFFKFSKAVHQYTSGQMSTAMTFILLWLLRFIGVAVIQDHFNDMATGVAPAAGAAPSVATGQGTAPDGIAPATPSMPAAEPTMPEQPVDPTAAPAPTPQQPTDPNQPRQAPTPPANPIG